MAKAPSENSMQRVNRLVESYCQKSGTCTHPDKSVTESVVLGLAKHMDDLGRPLCPCRFYPDKKAEIQHRTWICPCDDMNVYKYCHCLLFVNDQGVPITEHLPAEHEGRGIYGNVADPSPDKGRPLRHKAEERERERQARPS